MLKEIKPLLVTPTPKPSENLMGFILRTSEANGYTSPHQILEYAGLTKNEIVSINPPLNKISRLYTRSLEEFTNYGMEKSTQNKRTKKWRILNHLIPSYYLNIKNVKICPECIQVKEYIDCFSDLKFSYVCDIHQRQLIDRCPSCKKVIKWHRRGLLRCSCGQDLSNLTGDLIWDQSILTITQLFRWKLLNHNYDESKFIAAGYPLEHLKNISLSTLLGIIERLTSGRKRKTKFPEYPELDEKYHPLKSAHNILSDWPIGFFKFLENLSPENRDINSRNLSSNYRRIYVSLFKNNFPKDEIAFLLEAFVNYANNHLGESAYIDTRIASLANTKRRYVGILGLSEHLKVHPATVRGYIEKGLISFEITEKKGQKRKVFDLNSVPFQAREGDYLKQRDAINFLKMPLSILKELQVRGAYKITRLAWGIDGYNISDLDEFKKRFIEKAPKIIEYSADKHLSVGALLRKKKVSKEFKANILEDILNGSIIPKGRTGDEITDILIMTSLIS